MVSVPRPSLCSFYQHSYQAITVLFCLALSLILPLFSPIFFPLPYWVLLSFCAHQTLSPSTPNPDSRSFSLHFFFFRFRVIFFFFFASSVSKSTSTLPESHWNSVENDDQKRSKSVSLTLLSSWPKAGQIHNHSRRRSSPSPAVLGSNVLSTEKNIKKTPCRGVTNLYQGNRNFGSSPGWTC